VQGSGFEVQKFKVQGSWFMVQGSGFGFNVQGSEVWFSVRFSVRGSSIWFGSELAEPRTGTVNLEPLNRNPEPLNLEPRTLEPCTLNPEH
jgi:hypothetical protein